MRVQTYTLPKKKGKINVNDIVSKRRIWEEILQKSIEDLKKVKLSILYLKFYFMMLMNTELKSCRLGF